MDQEVTAGSQKWGSVVELLADCSRWCKASAGERRRIGCQRIGESYTIEDFNRVPAWMGRCDCFCLVGACQLVYGPKTPQFAAAVGKLVATLPEQFQRPPDVDYSPLDLLIRYNDHPGGSHGDVLGLAVKAGV